MTEQMSLLELRPPQLRHMIAYSTRRLYHLRELRAGRVEPDALDYSYTQRPHLLDQAIEITAETIEACRQALSRRRGA